MGITKKKEGEKNAESTVDIEKKNLCRQKTSAQENEEKREKASRISPGLKLY